MHLAPVRPQDIVEVDKNGRRFLAYVESKEPRLLNIRPFPHEKVNYFTATPHEVKVHYRKMRPKA